MTDTFTATVIPAKAGIQTIDNTPTQWGNAPNTDFSAVGTTDKTTSHLTKPLKRQVIGYSHSTRLTKNASQVAGCTRRLYDKLGSGLRRNDGVVGITYCCTHFEYCPQLCKA